MLGYPSDFTTRCLVAPFIVPGCLSKRKPSASLVNKMMKKCKGFPNLPPVLFCKSDRNSKRTTNESQTSRNTSPYTLLHLCETTGISCPTWPSTNINEMRCLFNHGTLGQGLSSSCFLPTFQKHKIGPGKPHSR